VVLDMTMPGMNGRDVYLRMKALAPKVRVLLTSGYTEDHARLGFSEGDLAGFIQKPYRASELVTAVQAAMARQEQVSG
jgi:DNA-binding NarL/FixJ family response regulator